MYATPHFWALALAFVLGSACSPITEPTCKSAADCRAGQTCNRSGRCVATVELGSTWQDAAMPAPRDASAAGDDPAQTVDGPPEDEPPPPTEAPKNEPDPPADASASPEPDAAAPAPCTTNPCEHGGRCTSEGCDCAGTGYRGAQCGIARAKLRSITASEQFTCALSEAGDVWCWGRNDASQLGDVASAARPLPGRIVQVSDVASLGRGVGSYTCAVTNDGAVWCWGHDVLASKQTPLPTTPGKIAGLNFIGLVAHSSRYACALARAGFVSCWGDEKTIDAMSRPASAPVPVELPGLALDLSSGTQHACVLDGAGVAHCWGDNSSGQINGTIEPGRTYGQPVPAGVSSEPIATLAAGAETTCAILADSTARCWGLGAPGVRDLGVQNVESLSVAANAICALIDGGTTVQCWSRSSSELTPLPPLRIEARQVSTGFDHTCVLARDDRVLCWGSNAHGQLGHGMVGGHEPTPLEVVGL